MRSEKITKGAFRKWSSNGKNLKTPALGISVDIKHFKGAWTFRNSDGNCFIWFEFDCSLDFLCSMWLYVQNDYSGLGLTALDWKLLYCATEYWFEHWRSKCAKRDTMATETGTSLKTVHAPLHVYYAGYIWKRRFYFENATVTFAF